MARTEAEREAFEEGRSAGATSEQIITLFKKIEVIEAGQVVILRKLDSLNSFRTWVMGAASVISIFVSVAYSAVHHWIEKLLK